MNINNFRSPGLIYSQGSLLFLWEKKLKPSLYAVSSILHLLTHLSLTTSALGSYSENIEVMDRLSNWPQLTSRSEPGCEPSQSSSRVCADNQQSLLFRLSACESISRKRERLKQIVPIVTDITSWKTYFAEKSMLFSGQLLT